MIQNGNLGAKHMEKYCDYCGLLVTEKYCTCQKGRLNSLKDRYLHMSVGGFKEFVAEYPLMVQANISWLIEHIETGYRFGGLINYIKTLAPQPNQLIVISKGTPDKTPDERAITEEFVAELANIYPDNPVVLLHDDISSMTLQSVEDLIAQLQQVRIKLVSKKPA
jgi:hypothetical protein